MMALWIWMIANLLSGSSVEAQEAFLETYCDRAIDAWTLHSPDFGEIRFLGIEPLEGREKADLEEKIKKDLSLKVEGKRIRLEFDGASEDSRGRLLAYVLDAEALLNAWMLKNGYARVPPGLRPLKHQQLFFNLQREAQENRRGIWGLVKAPTTEVPLPEGGVKTEIGKKALAKDAPSLSPSPGKMIASKKSKYYYRPGQRYYGQVDPRHRLYFDTEEAARRAGFHPYLKD
jgi:micrococcal nuclease